MRITPAKWDAEYAWLRQEREERGDGWSLRAMRWAGNIWSSIVQWISISSEARGHRKNRTTQRMRWTLGLALQSIGVMGSTYIIWDKGSTLPLITLMIILLGEVFIITSFADHRKWFQGEGLR